MFFMLTEVWVAVRSKALSICMISCSSFCIIFTAKTKKPPKL